MEKKKSYGQKTKILDLNKDIEYEYDFSEVKGQENVKRALEIAASGSHNCLLLGSPGSRKNSPCKKTAKYLTKYELRRGIRSNQNL